MKIWKWFDMIAYERTITPYPAYRPLRAAAQGYELLDPAQQLNRPRLLVVIEKERLMCQPADQVVAAAIIYKPRRPHVEQSITKPITTSMLLRQY